MTKSFSIVMSICCIAIHAAVGQTRYFVTDLGTLGSGAIPYDINDSCAIVGESNVGGNRHAFLWREGSMSDLGTLGGPWSVAFGINNSGVIVGQSAASTGTHAFEYRNGGMQDIGGSAAFSVSSADQIVGIGAAGDATLWQNGMPIGLGNLGGNGNGFATDINTAGQIVGASDHSSNTNHVFLYQSGMMSDLGIVYGNLGPKVAINDVGDIVGSEYTGGTTYEPFLYHNGNTINLGSLGGDVSCGTDINNNGAVVGFSNLVPSGGARHAFIYRNGTMTDLNTLINPALGITLRDAYAINDRGQIVCFGFYAAGGGGAFLLDPEFTVTRPVTNEVWIAGEADTIRWSGGPDTVDILISLDYENGSGTFLPVMLGYPADSNFFAIDIPDTILSRKCVIAVRGSSDSTLRAESGPFRIKGFVLTRLRSDSSYEPFRPDEDGWRFGNNASSMWPASWWQQFNYQTGIDPNTSDVYPQEDPFDLARPYDFVDWPLFVRVFDIHSCYLNTTSSPPVYAPSATQRWRDVFSSWRGSCSGFAVSSLLAFGFEQEFLAQFPIGTYANLYDLPVDDIRRLAINQLFEYYDGHEHIVYNAQRKSITVRETLAELKTLLGSDEADGRYLYLMSGAGAHAIVPYRLRREPSVAGFFYLDVYDSNYPGDTTTAVLIDSVADSWEYAELGWSGSKGCRLMDPVSTYLQHPTLRAARRQAATPAGEMYLRIYNTTTANILLTDENGSSIGFQDSSLIDSLPTGIPIIPMTSRYQPPIGYLVPENTYKVRMTLFSDSLSRLSVYSDSLIISVERSGASADQSDEFTIATSGISIFNPDLQQEPCRFRVIIAEDSAEKVIEIAGYVHDHNDSSFIGVANHDQLKLVNEGTAKQYTLNLRHATITGQSRFAHEGVAFPAHSSEEILPDWTDLGHAVTIYVDLGNNGTIDDTLFIDNILDVDERGKGGIPTEFALLQNYPNPFNPSTTIRYEIPAPSHVTLKIFDLLGREVATLVDEPKAAGAYHIVWYGNGINGQAPTGVYLYRLRAGTTVISKKMLLLR